MNQKQIDTWWESALDDLAAERLASGNQIMLEASTAKLKDGAIEIRGGLVPLTSQYVVELVVRETQDSRKGMALLFPEIPVNSPYKRRR